MTSGAHTYEAMRKQVMKVLVEDFHPDWESLTEEAYNGFLRDLEDDLRVELRLDDDTTEDDVDLDSEPEERFFKFSVFLDNDLLDWVEIDLKLLDALIAYDKLTDHEETDEILEVLDRLVRDFRNYVAERKSK